MADQLPTASSVLGVDPRTIPYAPPTPAMPPPRSGPVSDVVYASGADPAGRILSAFGYGAQSGWGAEPVGGWAQSVDRAMIDSGVWNDYSKGHTSWVKSFNEAIMRPFVDAAATGSEIAMRGINAAVMGGSGALGQTAREIAPTSSQAGAPFDFSLNTVRRVAAAPFGMASEVLGSIPEGFLPEVGLIPHAAAPEMRAVEATRGRAVGVVGEGEAGFYDAVPPGMKVMQPRIEAANDSNITSPVFPMPPADIHELARRVDPETFDQYDALQAQALAARAEIGRLGETRVDLPEVQAARDQIETILGKVNGVEDRLTKAAEGRLADARATLERLLTSDTEDMAAARQRLVEADYGMRDLAPQVSEAYRQAGDMAPHLIPEEPSRTAAEAAPKIEEALTEPMPGEAARAPGEGPDLGKTGTPAKVAQGTAPVTSEAPIAKGQESLAVPEAKPEQRGGAPGAEAKPSRGAGGGMRPVQGTGEIKTRTLAEGVEAKAIEDGLAETFGDLPEYHAINLKEQAEAAHALVNSDHARAKAIAMGEKAPPKGLLPESVFVAVEKRALAEGDVETLRALATRSKLTSAATTMGQRIRALGERDKASPVGLIADVQAAREAALKARNLDAEAEATKAAQDVKADMRRANKARPDAWNDFVATIRCDI